MLIGATKLNAKQIMHRIIMQVTLDTLLTAWCRGSPCVTLLGCALGVMTAVKRSSELCVLWCGSVKSPECRYRWVTSNLWNHINTASVLQVSDFQQSWSLYLHTHTCRGVCVYIYMHAFMVDNTGVAGTFTVGKQYDKEMSFHTGSFVLEDQAYLCLCFWLACLPPWNPAGLSHLPQT